MTKIQKTHCSIILSPTQYVVSFLQKDGICDSSISVSLKIGQLFSMISTISEVLIYNIYIEVMSIFLSFSLYLCAMMICIVSFFHTLVGRIRISHSSLHFEDSFLPLGASGSPQLGGFKLGSSAEVFSAKATGKHVAAQNGCNCIEFARCGSYYFVTLE